MLKRYLFLWILACWLTPLFAAQEPTTLPEIESGKVVFSWTELKKLLEEIEKLKQETEKLKQAQLEKDKKPEDPLPVTYSITSAQFVGETKGTSARFEATFSIQVLKEGWVTIPFFPNEIGIETMTFDTPHATAHSVVFTPIPSNQQGTLPDWLVSGEHLANKSANQLTAQFIRDTNGYTLIAKGPQLLTLKTTFHVPIQVEELTYLLAFVPPRSVVNHLRLRIPEQGVHVLNLPPHSQLKQPEANVTIIETVLSERDPLNLSWRIEKDSGISRKSLTEVHALASINKSEIAVFATLALKHITSLEPIAFQVPLDVEILNVTSLDIERWFIEKSEQAQIIKVTGPVDARTPVKIDLVYRLRLPELPADVTIPMPTVIGTDTLEGFLGVEVIGNLEATSKEVTEGLAIPAKNLPKNLWQRTANPLLYGYQFHLSTFSPALSIRSYQEIQTVVANVDIADCVTHRTLEGKSITHARYFIRNNDRQFLTLTLPENSHIWQAFLEGQPVKPAQKDTGEILIPMKKSTSQGEALQSFSIEIGYITEVSKLTLKGDILNQLPALDIPISYLKWSLHLPEYYEYSQFEGPLKHVAQFAVASTGNSQMSIPIQGQTFLFEKYLIVNESPYVRGKYGQFLGDDIFLSLHADDMNRIAYPATISPISEEAEQQYKQQVIPNRH